MIVKTYKKLVHLHLRLGKAGQCCSVIWVEGRLTEDGLQLEATVGGHWRRTGDQQKKEKEDDEPIEEDGQLQTGRPPGHRSFQQLNVIGQLLQMFAIYTFAKK